jgi:3-isopropylmalate dehydrogenase
MKIAVLPGDGIGPEVTRSALRVLTEVGEMAGLNIETTEHLIGGVAIRETGSPFPDETEVACVGSDAVFLGAVGDPSFDHLKPEERPEKGLLQLRKALGGFANLRPAKAYASLIGSSPLREEIFRGTDLMIIRELLGGHYFGEPRGTDKDEAFNTMRYSTAEVERVARVAFETARVRRGKVTSVDKANVLETSQLWRRTVEDVAKK